jgi:exosome complex component RRP40
VVGVIEDKTGDFYKVNIQSGATGMLSRIGFDGATKRNRPELKTGEVVYCRVHMAHKGLDTELTCIAAGGVVKKEWSTGESVYGGLNGGQLVKLSVGFCRYLLQPDNFLLGTLAK